MRHHLLAAILLLALPALGGCMSAYKKSIGADTLQQYARTYFTDLNTAWQAALEALKASPLDVSNREAGFIQTKWTDNTEQKNFVDSFADGDSIQAAKYRFRVNVAKVFYKGEPSVRIVVQKDQLIQRDVLEGWRYVDTDTIEENTLLYRIGRLVYIRMKLAKLEEDKVNQAMQDPGFGTAPAPGSNGPASADAPPDQGPAADPGAPADAPAPPPTAN